MTINSLSGSFVIEAARNGGQFEHTVIGTINDNIERRVRATNEDVQEWRDDVEVELDTNGIRSARAFVDARVFFPLLPYTLNGGDVHFEDLGFDLWNGQELHKVKHIL